MTAENTTIHSYSISFSFGGAQLRVDRAEDLDAAIKAFEKFCAIAGQTPSPAISEFAPQAPRVAREDKIIGPNEQAYLTASGKSWMRYAGADREERAATLLAQLGAKQEGAENGAPMSEKMEENPVASVPDDGKDVF